MTHYTDFSEIPRGCWDVICSDPPWKFATYSAKGKLKKSAELHYNTMDLDDIAALPVAELAAPDCALFLWATAPMLLEGLAMLGNWGFQYKSNLAWGKLTRHGKVAFSTGYRLRGSHEHLLLGVRGNPKNTRSERSLILAKTREHSQKPDEAAALIERWLPGARRIELFSRTARPGWSAFGDEIGKLPLNGSHQI